MTNKAIISAISDRVKGHLTPIRAASYLATAETILKANPTIDRNSLGKALIRSSELNLIPNTGTGESYIIPFKGQATLVIGVRGWQSLAYRSGLVTSLTAEVVFPSDTFKLELGDKPRLKHTPDLTIDRSATKADLSNILGAYAVARLDNGTSSFRFLTVAEIKKIKKSSQSAKVWTEWPEQMVKKTAMKQLIKYLPIATDDHINQARQIEDGELIEETEEVAEIITTPKIEVTNDEVNQLLNNQGE